MRRLLPLLLLALGCGELPEIDGRLIVVGFSGDPTVTLPSRLAFSDDGGRTWSDAIPMGDPSERLSEGFVLDGAHAWVIGNLGNVYRTSNRGESFQRLVVPSPANPANTWLDAVYFQDVNNGVVAGGNFYAVTADAGASWTERALPEGATYFDRIVIDPDGRATGIEGFLTPVAGVVWTSVNGGVDWVRALDTPAGLRGLAAVSPTELWAVGDNGQTAYTEDGGLTWSPVDRGAGGVVRPGADLTDVYFAGEAGWAVGSDGAVWRFDAGSPPAARWKAGSIGPYQLQGIWAHDDRIAVASGYESFTSRGVILRTTDGGRRWTEVAVHPGVFWHGLLGGLDSP